MSGIQVNKRDTVYLYLCIITVSSFFVTSGTHLVWTSPVILKLKSNDSEVNPLGNPVEGWQISLIVSMKYLGMMVAFITGKLGDVVGRKGGLLILSITDLTATLILAFGRSVTLYYVGRFVVGISQGAAIPLAITFMTEITEKHNRGKLICFMWFCMVLGNLYGYVIGPLFSVKIFSILCGMPLIISILGLTFFVPETPFYLVQKKQHETALEVLKKLRGKLDVETDLREIELTLNETSTKGKLMTIFKDPVIRKTFFICIAMPLMTVLSGTLIILSYVGPILEDAGTEISGNLIGILLGVIKVLGFILTMFIIEKAKRKTFLYLSGTGTCITQFLLGLYFYLKELDITTEKLALIPVFSVAFFVLFDSLGFGSVPSILLGELLPTDIKPTVVSIIYSISYVVAFVFPFLLELVGEKWCFWQFSAWNLLAVVYTYVFIPETKGLTLLEIQKMLKQRT